MFFADRFFGFDDAIYASLRLLEILAGDGRRLSEFLNDLPDLVEPGNQDRLPRTDKI